MRRGCRPGREIIEEIRAGGLKDLEGDLLTRQIRNDVAFHLLIMRAADRPKHLQVVSDLRILTNLFSQRGREGSRDAVRQLTRAHSEHCKIVEALEKGEATLTSRRMATHIRKGKEAALAYYQTRWSAGPEEENGDAAAPHIHDMVRKMELYTNVNTDLPDDRTE
jgi:DNA-binding GntR family transcriptional regulator